MNKLQSLFNVLELGLGITDKTLWLYKSFAITKTKKVCGNEIFLLILRPVKHQE